MIVKNHVDKLKKCWKHRWKSSPREDLLKSINNTTPSKKYLHLILGLDCRQASLLFQLWLGHTGLNHHLFCIHKSDTPVCPNCQGITVESVKHFLIDCPFYHHKRHTFHTKLRCNARSLLFLLSSPVTVLPVLKFVHMTGWFKAHFRKNIKDKILTKAQHYVRLMKPLTRSSLMLPPENVNDNQLPSIPTLPPTHPLFLPSNPPPTPTPGPPSHPNIPPPPLPWQS